MGNSPSLETVIPPKIYNIDQVGHKPGKDFSTHLEKRKLEASLDYSAIDDSKKSDGYYYSPPKMDPSKVRSLGRIDGDGGCSPHPEGARIHSGLGMYLVRAWAEELNIVLRPDMFWYTVVSECVAEILANPERYRHLFTKKKEGKITIRIETRSPGLMPVETLDAMIDGVGVDMEFKEFVIGANNFPSAPSNFEEIMKMTFCYAGTPFYDYEMYRCGIKKVMLTGSLEEWTLLANKIGKLNRYFPSLTDYLMKAGMEMNKIVINWENSDDMISHLREIFWVKENCKSGHPYHVRGWILNFYQKKIPSVYNFPSHITMLPWNDPSTRRMFYKSAGLTYSEDREVEGEGVFSDPQYATYTYEVFDEELFNKLARK